MIEPTLLENQPLQYHQRTAHILPLNKNILQHEIDKLSNYANVNSMVINKLKTKAAIFNPLRSVDVLPEVSLDNGQSQLEVVEEIKLLGQILTTDLRTNKNTNNIYSKAYSEMWVLQRLDNLNCPRKELIEILKQQFFSVVEQSVP